MLKAFSSSFLIAPSSLTSTDLLREKNEKKIKRLACQTRAALQCTVGLHNAQPLDSWCDSHKVNMNKRDIKQQRVT